MEVITEDIKEDILKRIGKERYNHTLRVMQEAVEISKIFGIDEEEARIAGYLHDCAKIPNKEDLFKEVKNYNLDLTEDMKKAPQIIHGFLGAVIAKEKYNIQDEKILKAVAYHTTGRDGMNDLEKVIFLADLTEPMRNFDGVEEIRRLSRINLDEAMLFSLNNTIKFLCKTNEYIALDTLKARNYILEILK